VQVQLVGDAGRFGIGCSGAPHLVAHRIKHQFRSAPIPVWPGLAEVADRRHYQGGIDLPEHGVVQTEGGHYTGAKVLDQDVGRAQQFQKYPAARVALEIEGDTSLVGIEMQKQAAALRVGNLAGERPNPTGGVAAAGMLDLDDVGAIIAKQLGAERSRHMTGQVKHPHSFQRLVCSAHGRGPRETARIARTTRGPWLLHTLR
jgi:hypothetical protein